MGAGSGGQDVLRPLSHFAAATGAAGRALQCQTVLTEAAFDSALAGAAGRPVVLDFYADWCVSCKEMDRFTFSDAKVTARLGPALLLKADVTANTEMQRALLRRFKLLARRARCFLMPKGKKSAPPGWWVFKARAASRPR